MQIDVETFVKSFRPDIMEVVYACAKGSKFYEIMEITQVSEGSLINALVLWNKIIWGVSLNTHSLKKQNKGKKCRT